MRLRHSTGRKRKRRERCCEKVSRGVGEAPEAEEEEEGGGEVTGEVMRFSGSYYWCNFLVKEDERKRKSVNMLGLMRWWIHA